MKKFVSLVLAVLLVTVCLSSCKKAEPEPEPVSVVSEPEPEPEMDDTTLYNGKTLKQYYEENDDSIGWLKIPGTKTDNIVMLGKDKVYEGDTEPDINFYLHHNFDKKYSDAGELYLDSRTTVLPRFLSNNLVIYGHHMANGTMLAGIDRYKNQSFAEQNPYISFNTLWQKHHFKVYACFTVDLTTEYGNAFDYREPFYKQQYFDEYLKELTDRKYYDTGETIDENSVLLTLSTCTYPTGNPATDDARLVVVARMCTDEEEAKIASGELKNAAD